MRVGERGRLGVTHLGSPREDLERRNLSLSARTFKLKRFDRDRFHKFEDEEERDDEVKPHERIDIRKPDIRHHSDIELSKEA